MESKDFIHLLVEIRDLQREHLEEYRRVTHESLELQRRAVARQEQIGRLYKRVLIVAGLAVIGGVVLIAHALGLFHKH
jgi:hypothetical protein